MDAKRPFNNPVGFAKFPLRSVSPGHGVLPAILWVPALGLNLTRGIIHDL
jgi:hypothetical protein